jgi:hypothetical protein
LTADDIRPLAATGCLPHLDKLELMFNPIGDDGIEALCHASWAGRIEHLGLMSCELSDRGAELLARGTFERLTHSLTVHGNRFTARVRERLRGRFGRVC